MITKADEYFLTIIKSGSLSKAAEVLYVSQPSLTKHIKHLEARLGMHLFNHDAKPLQLNAAGELYRQYLLETIRKEEQLKKDLQEANENRRGTLKLGSPSYLGQFLLPKILPRFYELYPNVSIQLTEAPGTVLQAAVAAGDLDIAFVHIPVTEANVSYINLSKEQIFLVMPAARQVTEEESYHCAPRIDPLPDLGILSELQYYMPREDQMLGVSARKLFASRNIVPKTLLCSGNPQTIMHLLVSMRRGASFMPSYVIEQLPSFLRANLIFYYLGTPELEWNFSVLYNKNKVLSVFAQQMISVARETEWKLPLAESVRRER